MTDKPDKEFKEWCRKEGVKPSEVESLPAGLSQDPWPVPTPEAIASAKLTDKERGRPLNAEEWSAWLFVDKGITSWQFEWGLEILDRLDIDGSKRKRRLAQAEEMASAREQFKPGKGGIPADAKWQTWAPQQFGLSIRYINRLIAMAKSDNPELMQALHRRDAREGMQLFRANISPGAPHRFWNAAIDAWNKLPAAEKVEFIEHLLEGYSSKQLIDLVLGSCASQSHDNDTPDD